MSAGKGDKNRLKGSELNAYKESKLWENIKKKKKKEMINPNEAPEGYMAVEPEAKGFAEDVFFGQ